MTDIDTSLVDEAVKIVTGARRAKYDTPERNFHRIALAWQALTDRAYTDAEVSLMMVALKLVRESHEHQRDNIVDGIGYLLTTDAVTANATPEPSEGSFERDAKELAGTGPEKRATEITHHGSCAIREVGLCTMRCGERQKELKPGPKLSTAAAHYFDRL